MTVSFLVRESAVVTAQAQSLDPAADSYVDLSQNVYAIFTAIDGVRYVKHLRNSSRIGVTRLQPPTYPAQARRALLGKGGYWSTKWRCCLRPTAGGVVL